MARDDITTRLKEKATALGFGLCGVCDAVAAPGARRLDDWLAAGFAGQMQYIPDRRDAYAHPEHVLEGVRSLVMLGMHYRTEQPQAAQPGQGLVSRYAWGERDYHDVIRARLHDLSDYLRELVPSATTRGVVDTAPLLEREFAQLAGLGWAGKNTLLISPQSGSYFFLAAVLTDVQLQADAAHETDHCGSCTACLDACPTDAFPQPYVLDASKCISYLTIELQDSIPRELRTGMGDWLFGCDVCQDVCPWNRHSPQSQQAEFQPAEQMNPVELAELFHLDDQQFRKRFRRTPLWRSHRRGLLRNAAIVLGNQGNGSAVEALQVGLADSEPLVRGACAWALGEIGGQRCLAALQSALDSEQDVQVTEELHQASDRAERGT